MLAHVISCWKGLIDVVKVKAKLVLKDGERLTEESYIMVPKEYVNRGMDEYIKSWLLESLKGKVRAKFEVVE